MSDTTLRPSNLPKLAVCACYEPAAEAGPAAERGTRLDAIFRRRIHGDRSDDSSTLPEDLAAVDWAIATMKAISGDRTVVTDEDRCRVEVLGMKGTADAWIPDLATSADLKTGQFRNYREQMAAYALGFMEQQFQSEWTVHLLFCDQRQLVTHRFSYLEAWNEVQQVIASVAAPEKKPEVCEYCSWCGKAESCPARLQLASQALASMQPAFDLEAVLADGERLGQFLSACAVLDDFRERAETAAKQRLISGEKIPGWTISSRKGTEFIYHDVVGRYVDRLGFGAVLAAYGNLSASKFRELWEAKMPSDTPFPEELIQRGKGSVSLRQARSTKNSNSKLTH